MEETIEFPKNVKYDDNYFKGMVFYHAKKVYVLEEYLYHWMVNSESISMQNDMTAHLDRMKVELLKIQEYQNRELIEIYRDEIEYIFLEQFYANTVNTIFTRNHCLPMDILNYMKWQVRKNFPDYQKNIYIAQRIPVWAMGKWVRNALKGIAQVRGKEVEISESILDKIAPYSFLDLLEADLTQEELDWYCAIYVAFDKVAGNINYQKLREDSSNFT